ncbi:MAG: hypothetical protein KJ941_03145, partial [Bacteroidetes bacterium]|nr:hypothetical protein [Bacteroidota bacterium]
MTTKNYWNYSTLLAFTEMKSEKVTHFTFKRYVLALTLFLTSLSFTNLSYAQCPVTAFASPMTVQCGDPISLTAVAEGCKPLNNNFNSGVIGSDWAATPGAVVTNGNNLPNASYNCVGPPAEGAFCLWMGATVAAPRNVTTKNYDLTACASVGANICFTMKFSTQGGPDPCEGIDLPEEGVYLEYSKNNGATWIELAKYEPNGGFDPIRTAWTRYCIDLPPAAISTSTQFRWIQKASSGAGFDTWGLDNMVINLISPGYTFDWAHDGIAPSPLPNTPDIIGTKDSILTVTYTNGIETCQSSVAVTVIGTTGSATATPVNLCAGQTSQLGVNATLIPPLPQNCGQSITGCQGTTENLNFQTGNVNETSAMLLGRNTSSGGISIGTCNTGNATLPEVSNFDVVGRMQFIINRNELPTYFLGGQLYRLELFPVGPAGAFNNVTVSIGCTAKSEFGNNTEFVNGLYTVFSGPLNFNAPSTIVDFQNHFDWPGGTNIVVQVCWKHSAAKTGNLFKHTTTNFASIFSHSCSGAENCGTQVAAARYQFRPDFKLGICYRPIPVLNYSWSPTLGLTDPTIKNPVATVNATTTYTVRVSDPVKPAACDLVRSIKVNVTEPTTTITPANPNICSSGGNVVLTATALPSQPGGTITSYLWSPAAGLSGTNTATVTASPTGTTTYTLVVTDNTGCTATKTVTVTVGQPAGPPAVNGERCGTGDVSIAVTSCSSPSVVNWYAASTGGTSIFTGNPYNATGLTSTTTYYATCTVNGCESTRTAVTATINSAPNAAFSYSPNSICKTGTPITPTITGSSGTFSSTPAGLTINTTTGEVTPSSSTVGTYTVTNTVPATPGCPQATATSSISITAPPTANFQYTGSPYCQNGTNPTPAMIGGATAGTFSSTAGLQFVSPTTGEINLGTSTPGTYTITNTVPAQNGCAAVTATFSITINAVNGSGFSYTSNTFCKSGTNPSPTITGTPGGTFTSSPAGLVFTNSTGTINLTSTPVGTYTITYTSPTPCSTTQTFTVNVTSNPVATFSYVNSPYCKTAANPNPTFSGGGIAGTFTSSPAGLVFVSTTTGQIDLTASTSGTYTVTNTVTASGCTPASATANVTITTPRTAGFTYPNAAYCQSETDPNVVLNAGATAGTFTASPAGLVFVASNGTVDLSATTPNTYTVTNTLTAQGGCPAVTGTRSITVNPNTTATFAYSSGTYCIGGSDPAPTITGTPGGIFSSTPAGLIFNSATTGSIDLTNSTANNYVVTYNVGGSCPSTSSVNINITNGATADFNYAGPYCLNDANPSPTFTGGATAGTFSSTAGLVFVNTGTGVVNLSASTPGTYTVTNTIGAASGCPTVSSTNTITLNPTDDATFAYSAPGFCASSATASPVISGTSGGNFSATAGLVFSNVTIGEVNLSSTPEGIYTVTYSTTGACPDTKNQIIEVNHQLDPTFEYPSTPYCSTDGIATVSFPTGGSAGNFTVTSGTISFDNPSTGSIDLAASGPGSSIITNTIAANGACPQVTDDAPITITAPAVADFTYPNNPYCLTGSNPIVQLGAGATAGTFSTLDPGVSIANTSNGTINLAGSTDGTFTITNTVGANGGCPAVSFDSPVTLTTPADGRFSYPANPYCQTGSPASIALNAGATAGTFTSTSPSVIVNATTGQIDVANSAPGTYKIYNSVNPNNGCPIKLDSANITIQTELHADFDFAPLYCKDATDPSPTFINGGSAGTFSVDNGGLQFISTSTGVIDMANSIPGAYVITNSIPSNGGCPAVSFTDNVTIQAVDNADFNYSQAQYCAQGTDPTPAITGTMGGIFSATPNGLSLNTSSGQIDLDASVLTQYTVSYTTQSACPIVVNKQVEIINAPSAQFEYNPSLYCQGDVDPLPTFINGGIAGTFSALPVGLTFVNTSTGEIDLSATNASNYNVTNTIDPANGCPGASFTTVITINAIPDAEFTYDSDNYCNDQPMLTPNHATGVDGTYSATPAGLSIDPATGVVNIQGSTPNTYTVQNVVAGSGSCPNDTKTFTLTIKPMPSVIPSSNSPVCKGESLDLAVATSPNTPGTTYSWTGPNSFTNNTQNPSIFPALVASSGDYTVQITTEGCTSFAILKGVVVRPTVPTTFGPSGPYCANAAPVNLTTSDNGGTWTGTGITNNTAGT